MSGDKYSVYARQHPLHVFWHPHQGFWNIYTDKYARSLRLRGAVVVVDTCLRCVQVLFRRARKLGLGSLFYGPKHVAGSQRETGADILLLDLGLHKIPKEILKVAEWFAGIMPFHVLAYEAHPDYLAASREMLRMSGRFRDPDASACDDGRPTIRTFNYAVVAPDYEAASIKLFVDDHGRKGDSLFRQRGSRSIDVPAIRLSEHLKTEGVDLTKSVAIVRMNIEGAEVYVLEDLESAGAAQSIDGWYGMWDDLFKIEPAKDAELRALMERNGIEPIPFNARDLNVARGVGGPVFRLREWMIRYDMVTSILGGIQRKTAAKYSL